MKFQTTYRQVRNAQDWARERAVNTRDELTAHVTHRSRKRLPMVPNTAQAAVEASEAELSVTPPNTVPAGLSSKMKNNLNVQGAGRVGEHKTR